MLAIRTLHMLAVGVCLFLIAKYWDFVLATVRGVEALMKRPFFDVDEIMAEIRMHTAHHRNDSQPYHLPLELLHGLICRWLCVQLRKVTGAGAGGR